MYSLLQNGKVKSICHTNTDCRITCLVILEGQNSNQKCMKEDVLQIHSIYNGTGNDKEAIKPKRLRKDSEDSESVNRIHDNKAKKKNLKLSEASQSLDVICTRGQKWLVEEL